MNTQRKRKAVEPEFKTADEVQRALDGLDAYQAEGTRLLAEGLALETFALNNGNPADSRLICIKAALRSWRRLHSLQSSALRVAMAFAAMTAKLPQDVAQSREALRLAGEHGLKTIPPTHGLLRQWIAEGEAKQYELETLSKNSNVGESNAAVYNTAAMDTAAAFAVAARTFSDRDLKEYVQKGEAAAAVLRERETTTRATATPRPDWIEARARGVALADFINERFAAELDGETMTRAKLRRFASLYQDYYNHLDQLPSDLQNLPTKARLNTRRLAEGEGGPVRTVRTEEIRLYDVARKRLARSSPHPPASG
jgi:hypothetical protein